MLYPSVPLVPGRGTDTTSHIIAILTGNSPAYCKDPSTQSHRGKRKALVESLTAALGSVID